MSSSSVPGVCELPVRKSRLPDEPVCEWTLVVPFHVASPTRQHIQAPGEPGRGALDVPAGLLLRDVVGP